MMQFLSLSLGFLAEAPGDTSAILELLIPGLCLAHAKASLGTYEIRTPPYACLGGSSYGSSSSLLELEHVEHRSSSCVGCGVGCDGRLFLINFSTTWSSSVISDAVSVRCRRVGCDSVSGCPEYDRLLGNAIRRPSERPTVEDFCTGRAVQWLLDELVSELLSGGAAAVSSNRTVSCFPPVGVSTKLLFLGEVLSDSTRLGIEECSTTARAPGVAHPILRPLTASPAH